MGVDIHVFSFLLNTNFFFRFKCFALDQIFLTNCNKTQNLLIFKIQKWCVTQIILTSLKYCQSSYKARLDFVLRLQT